MKVKMLEIRDNATRIPVIAIKTEATSFEEHLFFFTEGFGVHDVILVRPEKQEAHYDPFQWGNARTMLQAHLFIREHFDELENYSVVDVRVILGESTTPAQSEIWR